MNILNKVRGAALVLSCAIAVPATALAEETIRLTLATGLPDTFLVQKMASEVFAPEVNAELERMGSEYRVDWTIGHAGTIVKLPGIMQAVTDGIVDVGVTTQALEQSKMPLQNVVYHTPFGSGDHNIAAQAFETTQASSPAMNVWAGLNAVYLGAFPFDRYILVSKTPINSVTDMSGQRVGGIGPNLLWLQGTGAVGVVGTFATAYDDLQSGKIDISFNTPTSAASSRVYEVAPYVADVGFGAMSVQIAVFNKDRFDSLPDEVKAAIMTAAKSWQSANLSALDDGVEAAMATMRDANVTIIEFDAATRSEWANVLPDMAGDWADGLATATDGAVVDVINTYVSAQENDGIEFARQWRQ